MSGKGEDRQDRGSDGGTLRALALVTQLGFAVALPLVVFIAVGVWADGQFGTKPWLFFVGLLLGVLSAGAALYQIATSLPTKRYVPPAKKPPTSDVTGSPEGRDVESWDDDRENGEDDRP